MLTLSELKERILRDSNPEEILEALDISSEELLDRFEDKIEERYERLRKEFEDQAPESGG